MNNVRYPKLDERLQAVADLFTACDTGADIGADHGRLSCYLLHSQKCRRMVVADISADSLQQARRLLKLHALADSLQTAFENPEKAPSEKAEGKQLKPKPPVPDPPGAGFFAAAKNFASITFPMGFGVPNHLSSA